MKWIVFLLVFVNITVFLWHYRSSPQEHTQQTVEEQGLKLVLLEEYRTDQAAKPKRPQASTQAVQRCFTLGPFPTKKAVSDARDQLSGWGIDARQRLDKDKSRPGYWVMIPPSDSREQARAHIARLKENQITDYFLVATGEFKNAVSLGVFSRPELARRRLNRIQQMGFEPRLEEVDLPQREYWLDWPLDAGVRLSLEQLARLREQYEGIGQAQRACSPED